MSEQQTERVTQPKPTYKEIIGSKVPPPPSPGQFVTLGTIQMLAATAYFLLSQSGQYSFGAFAAGLGTALWGVAEHLYND